MHPVSRLARYANAWAQFGKIQKLTLDSSSLEDIVDEVFQYANGFFAPVQHREELLGALRLVADAKPRYIVEVGTSMGGTLLLWTRVAHPEATIVTIDLPGGDFGGGSSQLRLPLFRRFRLPKQKLYLIRADSHKPETLALTRQYLEGHEADFLFIDADHTEAGVRSDYQMYSPLVKKGGIILFHDIAINNPEYGVKKLWSELAPQFEHREFLGKPTPWGLGLLYH
jgi:predicted O-methyltransferase YrrM